MHTAMTLSMLLTAAEDEVEVDDDAKSIISASSQRTLDLTSSTALLEGSSPLERQATKPGFAPFFMPLSPESSSGDEIPWDVDGFLEDNDNDNGNDNDNSDEAWDDGDSPTEAPLSRSQSWQHVWNSRPGGEGAPPSSFEETNAEMPGRLFVRARLDVSWFHYLPDIAECSM